MIFSKTKQLNNPPPNVSTAEAYNLWDILTGYYECLEYLKMFRVYAHDPDLRIMLDDTISDIAGRSKKVENMMSNFRIRTPDSPRKEVSAFVNSQATPDELIGKYLLLIAQERIEMLVRCLRNAQYIDVIRDFFIYLINEDIKNLNSIIKYLKLKGWIEPPLLFQNVPPDCNEKINVAESYHIWNHLVFRYINSEQTTLFIQLVHDGDFKLLLKKGLDILKKQIKELEKEANCFGIKFPKQPPKELGYMENTEFIDDDFIFNLLLDGLNSASVIHAHAVKKALTNDRIRNFFARLLREEINAIDGLIKYGKVKGWLITPPLYRL